jgi:hypothetical protein
MNNEVSSSVSRRQLLQTAQVRLSSDDSTPSARTHAHNVNHKLHCTVVPSPPRTSSSGVSLVLALLVAKRAANELDASWLPSWDGSGVRCSAAAAVSLCTSTHADGVLRRRRRECCHRPPPAAAGAPGSPTPPTAAAARTPSLKKHLDNTRHTDKAAGLRRPRWPCAQGVLKHGHGAAATACIIAGGEAARHAGLAMALRRLSRMQAALPAALPAAPSVTQTPAVGWTRSNDGCAAEVSFWLRRACKGWRGKHSTIFQPPAKF